MSARVEWYDADAAGIAVVDQGEPVIEGSWSRDHSVDAEAAIVIYDVNGLVFTAMEGTRADLRSKLTAALEQLA